MYKATKLIIAFMPLFDSMFGNLFREKKGGLRPLYELLDT